MVEDLVFEEVNGWENFFDESDSDSENIDESDIEDNKLCKDESGLENEVGVEDGSVVSVKSLVFLINEFEIIIEE